MAKVPIPNREGMNVINSQSPIPEMLATPFIEADTLDPTHSTIFDDQIVFCIK